MPAGVWQKLRNLVLVLVVHCCKALANRCSDLHRICERLLCGLCTKPTQIPVHLLLTMELLPMQGLRRCYRHAQPAARALAEAWYEELTRVKVCILFRLR